MTGNARTGPGAPSALRAANHALVLRALQQTGETTQAALAQDTGLSAATVSNIVGELRTAGDVAVRKGVRGGKRVNFVSVQRVEGIVVCVCLLWSEVTRSGTLTAVAASAYENGPGIIRRISEDVVNGQSLATQCIVLVKRLVGEIGNPRLRGIVLGVPGRVDEHQERSLVSWVIEMGTPSAPDLKKALGAPALLENMVNLAALAELRMGVAEGLRHVVYMDASSTIGGALVTDGRVYRGAYGTAGRIGHISIDPAGTLCTCGNRGCLVTVAGEAALLRLVQGYQEADSPRNLTEIVTRALAGDPMSTRAVREAGRVMGDVATDIATLLGPQMIILGGTLTGAGPIFLDAFVAVFDDRLPSHKQRGGPTAVALARFPADGPLLGGLALARDHTAIRS
jgi:predicted NBD/HSP70 family sugar kinase